MRIISLIVSLALLVGVGAAVLNPAGVRNLIHRDPSGWDYTWLRQGLGQAEKAADAALKGAHRAGARTAATALQRAIRYSRASARSTGTLPIPPDIRKDLEPYFDEDLLDDVGWAYSNQYLDLGSVISAWYKAEGGAVTLVDTIVFSSRYGASRRFLWAHELTHVMQYRELGIEDFARVYVTNPQLLERQAWDNARRIEIAIQRNARRAAEAQSSG